MRRFAFLLLLTLPSPVQAATPLFDMFKAVCIDTRADPAAVEKAAEAAGGMPTPLQKMTDPWSMSQQGWSFGTNQLKDQLMAGSEAQPAVPAAPAQKDTSCSLYKVLGDKESLARLRAWAGVAPIPPATPIHSLYVFQEVGGKHVPMPNDNDRAAYYKAQQSGRAWMLSISVFGTSANIGLIHYLSP